MEGLIFDIKKYAIHDGPGIRTTIFLKGCPLHCPWCHNPEGIKPQPEIMLSPERCIHCEQCLHACERGALQRRSDVIALNREKCDRCGVCLDVCCSRAIEQVGRHITVEQAAEEIERDRVFYEESGGGVTLSGGEPLMQPQFTRALLKDCKKKGIHTVLDTCGYADPEILQEVSEFVDLFLFDVKIMDDEKHKHYTGVSNQQIFYNLRTLSENGKTIHIRIPIIPGITDDEGNIHMVGTFLAPLQHIDKISLLPYHRAWLMKHRKIKASNEPWIADTPSPVSLTRIQEVLETCRLNTSIGG
ncbi:MAG: glycyl-radical enzyme activating protein [candidate division WOR-3 bacterium]|nr:MAG: glycyl-radical enzyme activating protein [candidate division WOR-3 bacterium]